VKKFPGFGCLRVVLLLKSSSKGFHFASKIVVFDVFIALHNFGDIVCGCEILIGSNYCKTPNHPTLGVVWGHWANFHKYSFVWFLRTCESIQPLFISLPLFKASQIKLKRSAILIDK
jgi:hypothetical protein